MAENLCSWPCCHIAFSNTFMVATTASCWHWFSTWQRYSQHLWFSWPLQLGFHMLAAAHNTHWVCTLDKKGGRGKGGAPTSTHISLAGIVPCGFCQDESGWKSGRLCSSSFYSRSRWEQRGLEWPWAKKICTGSFKKFIVVANIKMTCPL